MPCQEERVWSYENISENCVQHSLAGFCRRHFLSSRQPAHPTISRDFCPRPSRRCGSVGRPSRFSHNPRMDEWRFSAVREGHVSHERLRQRSCAWYFLHNKHVGCGHPFAQIAIIELLATGIRSWHGGSDGQTGHRQVKSNPCGPQHGGIVGPRLLGKSCTVGRLTQHDLQQRRSQSHHRWHATPRLVTG